MRTLTQSAKYARQVVSYIWAHPANHGRRFRVLANSIRFQLLARTTGRRVLAPLGERSKIWAELHFTSSSRVVYSNPPDLAEMRFWSEVLQPGDCFIDGGANVGIYTLLLAERGAQVIAVEPGDRVLPRLKENIALNGYTVDIREVALAATNGTVTLHLTDDPATDFISATPGEGREIPSVTLDSIIGDRRVAGVKLDLEGAEELALAGGAASLRAQRIAALQLEWNDSSMNVVGHDRSPVGRILENAGYSLFRPSPDGRLDPVTDAAAFGPDVIAIAGLPAEPSDFAAAARHLANWRASAV